MGRHIGDYLVVDKLGEGGFGKVFLTLQGPLYKLAAALKLMEMGKADPEMSARMVKKFEGEATALAVLNHPNIVRLLKYGAHEGVPFLVMEYVQGGRTLLTAAESQALRGQAMEPARVRRILQQILDGLEAAHAQGVWHRDIKPENIMLQEVAGNPDLVRILDFGLAKFAEDGSRTSTAMGTPAYMAPEQMDRHGIGPWTDLYAVGVMAFELLTGRPPFPGQTWKEILARKLDPRYDPTSQLADMQLPPPALDFFRRALARQPEERYRTTAAFKLALHGFLGASHERSGPQGLAGAVTDQEDSAELARLRQAHQRLEDENRRLRASQSQVVQSGQVQAAPQPQIAPASHYVPAGGVTAPIVSGAVNGSVKPPPGARLVAIAIVGFVLVALGVALAVLLSDDGEPASGQAMAEGVSPDRTPVLAGGFEEVPEADPTVLEALPPETLPDVEAPPTAPVIDPAEVERRLATAGAGSRVGVGVGSTAQAVSEAEADAEAEAAREAAARAESRRRRESTRTSAISRSNTPGDSSADDAVDAALQRIRRDDSQTAQDSSPSGSSSESEPASDLPEQLTTSQVSRTVRRYRQRLAACQESGQSLAVTVTMTVQGSGRVSAARADNPSAGARCVVEVAQDMRFPEFSGDPMNFTYPFRIR